MSRKLTTKEFIEKAREKHGDKYDYSKTMYKSRKDKVVIICPEHGGFEQLADSHLAGKGCNKCSGRARKTTEQFILSAKAKHHGKYDYSKVKYVSARTKVAITCPIHGEFCQTPHSHLNGNGCPKCAGKNRTQEEWVAIIKDAVKNIEILEEICNCHKKILCRCKICRCEWRARPYTLKDGHGCPKCGGTAKLTHEEQIKAIREANPSIEVLERIRGNTTKVLCRCGNCGHEWKVSPNNIKQHRQGCPRCSKRGFLAHSYGKIYLMVDDREVPTIMKIGVSVNERRRRNEVTKAAQRAGAKIPDLYAVKTWEGPTEDMIAVENVVHKRLSRYKVNFSVKFNGSSEFFYYRPEVFSMVESAHREICCKHRTDNSL